MVTSCICRLRALAFSCFSFLFDGTRLSAKETVKAEYGNANQLECKGGTMIYETKDADGRRVEPGQFVRIRLSKLAHYGVSHDERHGYLNEISQDDPTFVTVDLGNGILIVKTNAIRVGPGVELQQPAVADYNWQGAGLVGYDVDGTEVNIGHDVRVRMSRVKKYESLGVTQNPKNKDGAGRSGTVFGVATDGSLAVTLFNGEHFVFQASDVRLNK